MVDKKEQLPASHPLPYIIIQSGLLHCVAKQRREKKSLLVVSKCKTATVLELTPIQW